MKLARSNRFLRSPEKAAEALLRSARTSSAVEGIRAPFSNGDRESWQPPTTQALIDHWKKKTAKSGR
jgi:hypothetical protein